MKKVTKGSSVLSSALQFLTGKPTRNAAASVRKSSARMPGSQSTRAVPVASPYRSAEIVCDKNACECARSLAGVRFLANDVPRLPLQGCAEARCLCTYTRHTDRRDTGDERRALFSVRTQHYSAAIGEDRRRQYGRRAGESGTRNERYDFSNWDI